MRLRLVQVALQYIRRLTTVGIPCSPAALTTRQSPSRTTLNLHIVPTTPRTHTCIQMRFVAAVPRCGASVTVVGV